MIGFNKVNSKQGEYWVVTWKGRRAGMIVPTSNPTEYIMLRRTDALDEIKELGRAKTVAEAKEFFLAKEREAKK